MQRYFSKTKSNNELLLESDDLFHIKTVMRMNPKDEIIVVHDNIPYLCEFNEDRAIIKRELEQNSNKCYVRLLIPLLKETKMDLILQKATELGVSEFILVNLSRSIIKLDDKKLEKKMNRWNRIVKEASEQSHRCDIPSITGVINLRDINLDGNSIVCSTTSDYSIKSFLKKNDFCDKINVLIGPEGGLELKEEELLERIGFTRISLGSNILRVETVPMNIMSIINYEYME